ncbi:replication initiation protein [Plebeiibacterium sediminum]|uniref:Replication initiation protein n=1 Tax=Plebeiibacterium sediminum TaxID=2992112 RepID=A0AAE3M8Y2_9BACT|nr:replication initiation protein [Plebeiobacterium sediminum]MCW3789404.1 replication initiation protein [Plebeiobacterium sediminum]
MNANSFQFPNVLNRAVHNFESALSKRMFYVLMTRLKKGHDLQIDIHKNLWIEVPTALLRQQHHEILAKASDELQSAKFSFLDEKNQRFNKIIPFPVVQYQKRWGHVKIKVEPEALQYLAQLTSGYIWIRLKSILSLNSKYSQRWFELFMSKKDFGEWKNVEIEYIKKLMQIGDGYKDKAGFLRRVVYEPINEINEKTPLFIEYTPINNQKRPILGFDFTIKNQEAKGEAEVFEKIERYYDELHQLKPHEIAQKMQNLIREYELPPRIYDEMVTNKTLLNAVLEADAKIKAGQVTIETTKNRYMGGVIKRAKREASSSNPN